MKCSIVIQYQKIKKQCGSRLYIVIKHRKVKKQFIWMYAIKQNM
jgi:hypothetical protein